MDKKKQIEDMTKFIEDKCPIKYEQYGVWDDCIDFEIQPKETAENFVNAGYGNIEKVLTDYIIKIRKRCGTIEPFNTFHLEIIHHILDEQYGMLIKEFYGDNNAT